MQFKEAVREIKNRLSIVNVVSRYVELKRNGARWVAPCPFHQETKPSFYVNEGMGMFYCFGCQASGDIFEFYSRINGVDFNEALEQLAGELGITVERGGISQGKPDTAGQGKSLRQQMFRMYDMAASHYVSALKAPEAEECRRYMAGRGLCPEIIERFGLGWARRDWQDLALTLEKGGFDTKLAVEAGLIGISDSGRTYDRFRGRLMFPIKSLSNQIIAFGGRIIGDEDAAKYINSADTPIYKKGEHLFGLAQARRGISAKGNAFLTEGYMDVLTMHQFGYDNTVGVLGTALTDEQVRRLTGFTSRITLLFDGDGPGRKAAFRAAQMFLVLGLSCSVVLLPDGEDIDSLLRGAGPEAFDDLVAHAPDGLRYCIDMQKRASPREGVEWARDFLSRVTLPELVSSFITRIAAELRFSEQELRNGFSMGKPAARKKETVVLSAEAIMEREILSVGLRFPDMVSKLQEIGAAVLLHSDVALQLWEKLLTYRGEDLIQQFTERERRFWMECCGPGAQPLYAGEYPALVKKIEEQFRRHAVESICAGLSMGGTTASVSQDLAWCRKLDELNSRNRRANSRSM